LHILFTITRYYPCLGGGELATRALIRELAKGNEVTVITQRTDNSTDWLYGTTINAPKEGHEYTDNNARVIQISPTGMSRLVMFPWVKLYDRVRRQSVRALAGIFLPYLKAVAKPDIIHNVYIGREYLSLASYRLAREYDIPFVFTPIAHTHKDYWNSYYMDFLYRNADGFCAMTEFEKDWLQKKGARGEIIVNGVAPVLESVVDTTLDFKARYTKGNPYLLFLGQRNEYKGYGFLIDVALDLFKKHNNLYLILMGAGFSDFKSTHERIIPLGDVTEEVKVSALSSCTALCLPSTEESFGGVFLEAFAFSKPVLGCPIKEVVSWLEDGKDALLIERDKAKWVAAIDNLLSDKGLQERLGSEGNKKLNERYTWDIIAERTLSLYNRLKEKHI
jgi:glycosyltransferase involved in cell wall biosynthesis